MFSDAGSLVFLRHVSAYNGHALFFCKKRLYFVGTVVRLNWTKTQALPYMPFALSVRNGMLKLMRTITIELDDASVKSGGYLHVKQFWCSRFALGIFLRA